MIDSHTHILPAVDDGAVDLEEALELLMQSAASGVKELVLTPHGNIKREAGLAHKNQILEAFEYLKRMLQFNEIPLILHLGMEVMGDPAMDQAWKNDELFTLGNSRYLLVEFPFTATANYAHDCLRKIETWGLKPVIAHPERYKFINENPSIAYEWNQRGYFLQINSGSILGEFGETVQQTAQLLLEHQLAQLVASDCHHSTRRRPNLAEAWQLLARKYSPGYSDLLLKVNPRLLLADQPILIINPKNPQGQGVIHAY